MGDWTVQHIPSLVQGLENSCFKSWTRHSSSGWPWAEEAASLLPFVKCFELQMEMLHRGKAWLVCWWVLGKHGSWKNMWRSRKVVEREGREKEVAFLWCCSTWARTSGSQRAHVLATRTSDKSACLLLGWFSLHLSADQMMHFFEEAVITEEPGSTFLWW